MSSFPRSPYISKGVIEIIDPLTLASKSIQFQYNPDTITRTLTPKTKTQTGNTETFRLEDAPDEEITVDIELDATDQLEYPNENTVVVKQGINPQLSALETILYPPSDQIISNAALAEKGEMEIIPPAGPMTLFIFGTKRILPVRITRCQITEEAYDTTLNPIRAKVTIAMKVLTYTDLQRPSMAYSLYHINHVNKETAAELATTNKGYGLKHKS